MAKATIIEKQNLLDFLLTNQGDISNIVSFLSSNNMNYEDFETKTGETIYVDKTQNKVTNYYQLNNMQVATNINSFDVAPLPAEFNIDFNLDFNA